MNTKSRIRKLRTALGYNSDAEFAEFLEIKPNTLSTWYTRDSMDVQLIFAKCDGVNANWLLSGKGEMFDRSGEGDANKKALEIPPPVNMEIVFRELALEIRESRLEAKEDRATTLRSSLAAVDMAASVKEIAQSMNTRLEIVEEDLEDVASIAEGVRESLVQLLSQSTSMTDLEIRGVVNTNVKDAYEKNEKKKRGTQTSTGTLNTLAS